MIPVDLKSFDSEAALKSRILEYLERRNIFAFPTHDVRNRPVMPGVPDIIAVLWGGKILAIEVKAREGRVRREQQEVLSKIRERLGLAVIARSVQDVAEALR